MHSMWKEGRLYIRPASFLKEQPELLDDYGSSHSQCKRAIVKCIISEMLTVFPGGPSHSPHPVTMAVRM